MTSSLIRVTSESLPDVLPRAMIPFADDCAGLYLHGINDEQSRKPRNPGGAILNVRGSGPASFTATSMFTSVNANNYQTPFNIIPHSYSIGGYSTVGALATNGVDPGPTYGWLPYFAGPNVGSLSATIFGPGGGYVAATLGSEQVNLGPPDVTATYVKRFAGISERALGLDAVMEDGGFGGGIVFVPLETPSPAASSAAPVSIGQALYGGAGFNDITFIYRRPLTTDEWAQLYLWCRRLQALRTGVTP